MNKSLKKEWQEFNNRMKRLNLHSCMKTYEEYREYRYNPKKYKSKSKQDYSPNYAYRNNNDIPSLDTGVHDCSKNQSKIYTGDLVKGIATMHKSNAVPVISKNEAISISNMRRN